jgi:hypothetical protein
MRKFIDIINENTQQSFKKTDLDNIVLDEVSSTNKRAIKRQKARDQLAREAKLREREDEAIAYVLAFDAHGRKNSLRLEPWEQAFQDEGVIELAYQLGYINIGRDVACTVSLTDKGEQVITDKYNIDEK